ncbi:MAG: hypothetical protein KAI76_05130, partial [Alphaproteobacteria bacterium]|nr:hypothetical protein [Alphaproteobacteria bacterium]
MSHLKNLKIYQYRHSEESQNPAVSRTYEIPAHQRNNAKEIFRSNLSFWSLLYLLLYLLYLLYHLNTGSQFVH